MSSLWPCTTRGPRFTRVSEGNPRRRLLVGSKARSFVFELLGVCRSHGAPPSFTPAAGRRAAAASGTPIFPGPAPPSSATRRMVRLRGGIEAREAEAAAAIEALVRRPFDL